MTDSRILEASRTNMSSTYTRDEWIIDIIAPELEQLEDSSTHLHLDEAIAFSNYLNGELTAESAAQAMTVMLRPAGLEPSEYKTGAVFRIMGHIATALMLFDDDSDRILDLLVAIQNLPPLPDILWWKLPGFDRLWQHCYISYRDMYNDAPFFKKAGTLEANMYLKDLYPVDDDWAYRAISLICLEGEDLELIIYEIHAWLDVAGSRLAENLQPTQVKSFERAVRGRREKTYYIEATMYEHWAHWKKRFLQVSYDEDFLSPEFRLMARKCHEIMKGLVVEQPDPPSEK
jgi:hypothetical protein